MTLVIEIFVLNSLGNFVVERSFFCLSVKRVSCSVDVPRKKDEFDIAGMVCRLLVWIRVGSGTMRNDTIPKFELTIR